MTWEASKLKDIFLERFFFPVHDFFCTLLFFILANFL